MLDDMLLFHVTLCNISSNCDSYSSYTSHILLISFFTIFFQTSCTSTPSMIQHDTSQCIWNQIDLNCSLRPPPNDPISIILIALLTAITTIPLLMVLHYVLIGYASHWPVAKASISEIDTETEEIETVKRSSIIGDSDNLTMAKRLRNLTHSSSFKEEAKKELPVGDVVNSMTADALAQIAYSGMSIDRILILYSIAIRERSYES